jgi:hypothetical protein
MTSVFFVLPADHADLRRFFERIVLYEWYKFLKYTIQKNYQKAAALLSATAINLSTPLFKNALCYLLFC